MERSPCRILRLGALEVLAHVRSAGFGCSLSVTMTRTLTLAGTRIRNTQVAQGPLSLWRPRAFDSLYTTRINMEPNLAV